MDSSKYYFMFVYLFVGKGKENYKQMAKKKTIQTWKNYGDFNGR
jgi:hypothetical protein